MDQIFVFNQDHTIAQNFHRWYTMDCDEREVWGEYTLDYPEAIKYFSRLYGIASVEMQDSLDTERTKYS